MQRHHQRPSHGTLGGAALVALLVVSCARTPARQDSADAQSINNTTAQPSSSALSQDAYISSPVAQGDLALFAPLPARMVAPGEAPTAEQVALGRTLYYETRLSQEHTLSCNGCHPLNAYGADGRALSLGGHGQPGGRNSPSTYNAAGQVAQFWDGRAATVEEQAKGPVLNPAEMGMPDADAVLTHMRADPQYVALFRAAFPAQRAPITYDNMGRAIGAFERGLVTPARWDRFLAGDRTALTPVELRGFKTFLAAGCAGCHNGAYVGGASYQKLGLANSWPTYSDSGRFAITHRQQDIQVFKVPSLRNVAKTAPYFHDGSVAALPDAIRLMAHHQLNKDLSPAQVQDIAVWLGTLTGDLPVEYIAHPPQPTGRTIAMRR